MDIISLEKFIRGVLPMSLQVSGFEVVPVNKKMFPDIKLLGSEITAFTFVVNNFDRYYVFSRVENGKPVYTRPKGGVVDRLTTSLTPRDFRFNLDSPLGSRFNMAGKLVEIYTNRMAAADINELIESYAGPHVYQVGFKVTIYDKHRLTFNADFSLFVKQNDGSYKSYRGEFIKGKFNRIVDDATGKPSTLVDVFKI